ncbi:MAG: OprD family porin, partial [Desulfovibrionales bacterium]|nr:OprD family porin [Desulfovibrionales bacterium]
STSPAEIDRIRAVIDDSMTELSLRNIYINRNYRNHRTAGTDRLPGLAEAWSQGACLDISSGYYRDTVGFHGSWYGALKLVGDKAKFGSGVLHEHSATPENGHLQARQTSYNKLGQVYLNSRLGGEVLNASLRLGRMFINTPLLNDDDSRTTPSTTQGLFAEANYLNSSVYSVLSDRSSLKTQTGFHKYENSAGDSWKIYVLGGYLDLDNGLYFHIASGTAPDYKKRNYLNLSYNLKLAKKTDLLLDGQYQTAKSDGFKLKTDLNSKLFNIATRLTMDSFGITLSYQQVNDNEFNYSWGGSDSTELNSWNAVQVLDFNRKDEKSWQGRIDYSFAGLGIPGLSIMTRYIRGEYKDIDINSGRDRKRREWEWSSDLKYSFRQGNLAGLTITLRNAVVRGDNKNSAGNDFRFIVNHTLPL